MYQPLHNLARTIFQNTLWRSRNFVHLPKLFRRCLQHMYLKIGMEIVYIFRLYSQIENWRQTLEKHFVIRLQIV